jgi:hypothetical protein
MRRYFFFLTLFVFIGLAGCLTFEVGIERPPIPDQSAVGTLASLMVEGTRWAYHVTQISLPPTPTPSFALVQGQICYPGQGIPAMNLYFRRLEDNHLVELAVADNQDFYSIELSPGEYYAYAWVERYQVGGLYSLAVACGLHDYCLDHSPQAFNVQAGQVVSGINLCDWVFTLEQLPTPPDQSMINLRSVQ